MPEAKRSNTQYFATRLDTEIVPYLREKVEEYSEYLSQFGHAERIAKSLAYNAGGTIDDSGNCSWKIQRGGEMGEVLLNAENHYRAIGQSAVNLTTAQRPSVQFLAKNSDKQSVSRAAIGNELVESYLQEAGLEAMFKEACELMVFATEAFIFVDWERTAGPVEGRVLPEINPETGLEEMVPKAVPIGDVRFRLFDTEDVIRNPYLPSWRQRSWVILRDWVSKWDVAAKYPELAGKISTMGPEADDERVRRAIGRLEDHDLLPVYEFYHEKTAALPEGRYVKFVGEIWLEGGPLPFDKIPLARGAPGELRKTPFGYSVQLDLLGAQETINGLDTSITTNQLGRGIGNMLVPANSNLSVELFGSAMNAIKYDGELQPEPLNMPPTPPEMFQYKKDKIQAMETISGIGSVVRGSPSENIGADASGSKLVFLQSQAVQQNNGLEKSYVQMIRDVAMNIIKVYRDFGGSEARLLKTIGKNNAYLIKEFYPSDLDDIGNVVVDIGNPVTRQISGRMALADRLTEMQLIKPENVRAYITLIKEGTIDPMIEAEQASMLRIQEENEKLLSGDQQWQHRALVTDEHWVEIPKHLELMDNPDLRQVGQEDAQQRILAAVQEHIQLFGAMPPALVLMRGGARALEIWQQIVMAQGGPGLDAGAQPGGPQQPAPGGPPTGGPSVADELAPEGMSAQPTSPAQPRNPATGERAPAPRGVVDE